MIAAKHTPAPWWPSKEPKSLWLASENPYNPNPCLMAIDAVDPRDGKLFEVCAVWGINASDEDSETAQANIRLIAAAPKMFEALKLLQTNAAADEEIGERMSAYGVLALITPVIAEIEGE